ncbi:MAG: nucleotidyltransferase domain-containing protein [Nitrospirae bacterium]|nr:nucleotidyltransferase domain-containing protein [Nitrospirota bacterium]
MAGDRSEIIAKIETVAEKIDAAGYRLVKVYLYGSYAKGAVHEYSDIDAAFVSPDFHPESMEEWSALLRICNEVDLRIEPVFYRPEAFVDEEPLAWNIKTSGIEVPLRKAA